MVDEKSQTRLTALLHGIYSNNVRRSTGGGFVVEALFDVGFIPYFGR